MGRAAINVRVAPVVMLVSNLVHSQNTRIATVYGYDRIVPKETGDKVRAGVNHPRWNLNAWFGQNGYYLTHFLPDGGKIESTYPPPKPLPVTWIKGER